MAEQRIARATQIGQVAVPDTSSAGAVASAVGRFAGTVGQAAQSINDTDQRTADQQAQLDQRNRQQADQKLSLAQSAALARLQAETDVQAAEFARSAAPGAGYREQLAEWRAARLAEFDAGFGDNEEVRQRFAEHVARYDAGTDARAELAAIQAAGVQQGNDWTATTETLINSVRGTPTLARLQEAQAQAATAIASLSALTPEARADAARELDGQLWGALSQGMIDAGQDQALGALIQQGALDEQLSPDVLGRVRGQVRAAGEARQIAAEQAASEARRMVRDRADAMKLRIDAGELPDARELDQMVNDARAAGLPVDQLTEIGLMVEDAQVNRRFAAAPTASLIALQGQLAGQPVDRLSSTQQRLLHRLPDMISARAERDVAPLRQAWATGGTQGQAQVAAQIYANPDPQSRFRQGEAVAPGLGYLMAVRPTYHAAALEGAALVAANPDLAPAQHVDRNFRAVVGGIGNQGALRLLDAGTQEAVGHIARNIYVARGGRFDARGTPSSMAGWENAVTNALGGSGTGPSHRGGMAQWNGRPIVLPPTMTPARFGELMGQQQFASAVDAQGRALPAADIRRAMIPVFRGMDGNVAVYYVETPNGQQRLRSRDGGWYQLRVTP